MKILWSGPCYGTSGYANAGREMLLALHSIGVQIQLLPESRLGSRHRCDSRFALLRSLERPHKTKAQICISHQVPNRFQRLSQYNVGITYWETNRIPNEWVTWCNQMDHLILFSEMNRRAFQESGVKVPIDVLPSGVGISDTKRSAHRFYKHSDTFIFLAVSAWIPRKGFDVLIRAYLEEFNCDDNVLLVIKTNRPKRNDEIAHEVERLKSTVSKTNKPPIMLQVGRVSQQEMLMLYKMSDAYVLPSRGEGVGLTYLEAGAAGLPVIATGWGGQTDFLNDNNSYLIRYSMVAAEPSEFSPWYSTDQLWAEPDFEHLKYLMRTVYENRKVAQERTCRLTEGIRDSHRWESVARSLRNVIWKRFEERGDKGI